jgi:mannose-1-phosphate guanylyltransferase
VSRWAVVLAGGVGSRFWPLSTPTRPKQLLPLVTSEPLLAEAVARLHAIAPADRVLILTNDSLVPASPNFCPEIPRENLIAEPRPGRHGRRPDVGGARDRPARWPRRRDDVDSRRLGRRDSAGFHRALSRAAEVAEKNHVLATVGVVPTRADPGFGYIQPGKELEPGSTKSRASSRSRIAPAPR